MRQSRGPLTIRVVPLTSVEGNDLSGVTTPAQRLALVEELTREGWTLAGLPFPEYARTAAPIRLATLERRSGPTPSA